MNKVLTINPRFQPGRLIAGVSLLLGIVFAIPAWTTMEAGIDTLQPIDPPVSCSWTSTDAGISGTMSAVIKISRPAGSLAAFSAARSCRSPVLSPQMRLIRCGGDGNTAGMMGGGRGECQFNGGRIVDAVFPSS